VREVNEMLESLAIYEKEQDEHMALCNDQKPI